MELEFEWDPIKADGNLRKHGIDFEDAIHVFGGPILARRSDRDGEERYQAIGVLRGVEIAIVYTPRENRLRIISARRAGTHERAAYHKADLVRQSGGSDGLVPVAEHDRGGNRGEYLYRSGQSAVD